LPTGTSITAGERGVELAGLVELDGHELAQLGVPLGHEPQHVLARRDLDEGGHHAQRLLLLVEVDGGARGPDHLELAEQLDELHRDELRLASHGHGLRLRGQVARELQRERGLAGLHRHGPGSAAPGAEVAPLHVDGGPRRAALQPHQRHPGRQALERVLALPACGRVGLEGDVVGVAVVRALELAQPLVAAGDVEDHVGVGHEPVADQQVHERCAVLPAAVGLHAELEGQIGLLSGVVLGERRQHPQGQGEPHV
jgi:hypothetical protein